MEYIYYRPRRGFTHRLVLLVRQLKNKYFSIDTVIMVGYIQG
jgi:hypothetical protein